MSESADVSTATTVSSDDSQKCSETESEKKLNAEDSSVSFVKSVLNRQGSVNYCNAAWKPTPPVRQSSLLSMKSNSSGGLSHPSSAPGSPITKSPTDQQAYLESQFTDIYNILKNCFIDEDILLKIKK